MGKIISKKWQGQKNDVSIKRKYDELAMKEKERYKEEMALYKKKKAQNVAKFSSSYTEITTEASPKIKLKTRKKFKYSQEEINNQCSFGKDEQYYSHTEHFLEKDKNKPCHSMPHQSDPGFATEKRHEPKNISLYDKLHTSCFERSISNKTQTNTYLNESKLHSSYSGGYDFHSGMNKKSLMRENKHETGNSVTAPAQHSNSFSSFIDFNEHFKPKKHFCYTSAPHFERNMSNINQTNRYLNESTLHSSFSGGNDFYSGMNKETYFRNNKHEAGNTATIPTQYSNSFSTCFDSYEYFDQKNHSYSTSTLYFERNLSNINQTKNYSNESSLHSLSGTNKDICIRGVKHENGNTETMPDQDSNSFSTFFDPYECFELQKHSYYKENDQQEQVKRKDTTNNSHYSSEKRNNYMENHFDAKEEILSPNDSLFMNDYYSDKFRDNRYETGNTATIQTQYSKSFPTFLDSYEYFDPQKYSYHTSTPYFERNMSNMNQAKSYSNESSMHRSMSMNKDIFIKGVKHENVNTETIPAQDSNSFSTFFDPYKCFEPQKHSHYKENDQQEQVKRCNKYFTKNK